MDSVALRQSHFKLGDEVNPYETTSMIQSNNIENAGPCNSALDEALKNDLRRHHFVFGNDNPNYNTEFRREYYDKSSFNPANQTDFYAIERKLKTQNFDLGNYKPDYLTETAEKYTKPQINPEDLKNQQKISTAELQQSHYVFGTQPGNWNTTFRASYTPKKADNTLFTKNLAKTNFVLGDAEPTLKSVNQETYVRHPIIAKPINQELANDLRRHHFDFGKDNPQLFSVNELAYQDPSGSHQLKPTIDSQLLRQSHWSLGDKTQEPPDLYDTTYTKAMTPKKAIPNPPLNNNTYNSSFSITGNGPMEYQSDYRANYIPINSQIDPKDVKTMQDTIKNIKNSHFNLGDMPNDYATTMGNSYQFDPNLAKGARGQLDRELINDLRATHYKFGDDPLVGQTTQRRDYVPYDIAKLGETKGPHLQDSHFNIGDANNNKLDGKTIYMTDYIPKPIPIDEANDCWC